MDGIQIPGRQEPGRQEPLELPGRNSSTYGDGDIPEIDLPACSPDKPGLHFLRVFNPSRGSNHAIYCDIIVFNTIYRIRGVIIWKYRSVWELKTGWESISGNTNTVIRMKPLNSGLDASAGGFAIAELIREKKVLEGGRNLYKSCGRSKCQNRHINGGGGI